MEGVMSSEPMLRRGGALWADGVSMYSSSSYHMAAPGRLPPPPPRRDPRPMTRMLSTVLMGSPVRGRLEELRVWMGAPSVQGETRVSMRWY